MKQNDNFVPAFLPFLTKKARYKFAVGGRGSGKSEQIADCLVLLSAMMNGKNILNTRQTQTSISDSVYSKIWEKIENQNSTNSFKKTLTEIIRNNGTKFLFRGLMNSTAQNSVKSISNIQLSWTEEAHSVTQEALDLLIPSVRNTNSELWFTWNPYAENDAVYKLFNSVIGEEKRKRYILNGKEYFWTEYTGTNSIGIKINFDGNPFFPDVLNIDRLNCYNNFPDDYGHIWLGEVVSKEMSNIIQGHLVRDAMNRQVSAIGIDQIGCDVARFGDDKTEITRRKGNKVLFQRTFTGLRTYEVANKCIEAAESDQKILINVDETGIGGGVVDDLYQKGYNVAGVNNNAKAKDQNKYDSAIDEMWFEFRDVIDYVQLPKSEELKDQLTLRRYGFNKNGKRFVEPKKEYKKRVGKSPDKADSLLLAFYNSNNQNKNIKEVDLKLW